MATGKLFNQSDLADLSLMSSQTMKKIPPIESVATRKPKKFLMTDSLVAPVKKFDVPNHVLNTKIYAKLQRNEIFEVEPVEIHFAGFEVATETKINNKNEFKKYIQKFKIINISGQVQRMTVLPPQTKYFDVHYVKPERLVPGFALEVECIFRPEAYKYYYDSIRIFSESEENLYVPIHAYPIVSTFDFPSKYSFPNLSIGRSATRTFRMRSTAPVEFEYIIEILQRHSAFSIQPLEGIIPFNRDAEINVTFSPKQFCTATMTIQLIVSQFNSKPIQCTFFGTSMPGMARDEVYNKFVKENKTTDKSTKRLNKLETTAAAAAGEAGTENLADDQQIESDDLLIDPRVLSPLHLSRTKRNQRTTLIKFQDKDKDDTLNIQKDQYVNYEGYRIPKNLNNPWAVSKILIQKQGKLSHKELRTSSKTSFKITAQAKEALFLQKVLELEDEERRNQLKWQVKLGEDLVDQDTRDDILNSRAVAEYEYKKSIGVPFLDQEIYRDKTVNFDCRTVRMFNKLPRTDITFDSFKNQIWQLRFLYLDKFIQAARKIIVKRRLEKVLNLLKKFIDSWNEAIDENFDTEKLKVSLENYIEIYVKKLNGQNLNQHEELKVITAKSIGTYYFPQVTEFREIQNQNSRHCEKLMSISKLDSLGVVAVKPVEFQVQTQTPYINLAIPVTYKLNDYRLVNENTYVPKHENRLHKLRVGAEDELTQIDSNLIISSELSNNNNNKHKLSNQVDKSNLTESKLKTSSLVQIAENKQSLANYEGTKIIDLVPLKQLSEPIDYPPLHIFNPAPGLVSYNKLMPYSGVDLNHHLNPLPRFERDQTFTTQKRFLDRDDVIKGLMTWKKFPSQGLTSLSNTPTLTDVWVPRWSNAFGTNIMPFETPPLLAGLPADDKENLLDEPDQDNQSTTSKDTKIFLTPEMVNVQFNIPDIFEIRERNIKEETQFPNGDKLPTTNLPVSSFGQVPRDQRQQELEYFLGKQYNLIGMRIQTKLNSIDKQFLATSLSNTTSSSTNNSNTASTILQNQNSTNIGMQPSQITGSTATLQSAQLGSNSTATIVHQDH